jgi:DNA-binding NarL/FixJ family response regulator
MTATALHETLGPPREARRRLTLVRGDDRAASTIRVVVAHGQRLSRAGLRALLEPATGLDVIGEAADGDEAVALVRSLRPDIVVMDVHLPGLDCVEATRQMIAKSSVAVLVLTAAEPDDRVLGALRAGAARVLLVDREPAELIGAVRLLARGGRLSARRCRRRGRSRKHGWSTRA